MAKVQLSIGDNKLTGHQSEIDTKKRLRILIKETIRIVVDFIFFLQGRIKMS